MEIEGKIIQCLPLESGVSKTGKQWQKAEIIIETSGSYPKKIKLQNFKEAVAFSQLPAGYSFRFYFDIESREWTNRQGKTMWFTEATCYKWETITAAAPAQPAPQQQYTRYATPPAQPSQVELQQQLYPPKQPLSPQFSPSGDEDLPF